MRPHRIRLRVRSYFSIEWFWIARCTVTRLSLGRSRFAAFPWYSLPGEIRSVLRHLDGQHDLIVSLLYGSGLRLMECLRLRVKDVDTERLEIGVRDAKGGRGRITVLPESVRARLS